MWHPSPQPPTPNTVSFCIYLFNDPSVYLLMKEEKKLKKKSKKEVIRLISCIFNDLRAQVEDAPV